MVIVKWFREGSRCKQFGAHVVVRVSRCTACGNPYDWCTECEVNTSCCGCGFNHSIDCTNP